MTDGGLPELESLDKVSGHHIHDKWLPSLLACLSPLVKVLGSCGTPLYWLTRTDCSLFRDFVQQLISTLY